MLSQLIGPVDMNAAAVLVAISITLCIIITTMVAKRRSRRELEQEFELAKIKLRDERDIKAANLQNTRDLEFKRIDQNLITSHSSSTNPHPEG